MTIKINEKSSVPQILALEGQLIEINRPIDLIKVPDETINKWIKKAESTCFEEMTYDQIQKCIDHLKKQIEDGVSISTIDRIVRNKTWRNI